MKSDSFLSHLAQELITQYPEGLGQCTVIFPNRRAGLFLKKELSRRIERPVWSPEVLSLEDFLLDFSATHKADPLTLIFELYEAFRQHQTVDEGFESFYFWGEMLLRDFEEVDHYLVEPDKLFHYIKSDKQLAEDFYFLNPEQEKLIQRFWQDFFPTATRHQQQFMETWKILAPVYHTFKERLKAKGIGYTSHIYRSLIHQQVDLFSDRQLIFAGFNALTPVEEQLIRHFIREARAQAFWDLDAYYLKDEKQEAGTFLRKYASDTVLGQTFPEKTPDQLSQSKTFEAIGVSLEVGQAKAVAEQIEKLLAEGVPQEEIVVVLPQEYMLFPVLNSLPPSVDKLNVTMGYPLKETPLFGLLEAAIELQDHAQLSPDNGLTFYFKPVMDILGHPYLFGPDKEALDELADTIRKNNQVRVFQSDIQKLDSTILNTLFRVPKAEERLSQYLLSIVQVLGSFVRERFGLEREYLYHFQLMLSRLDEILGVQPDQVDIKTFKSLFRKASASIKIPFSGEPVEGLQVMGALETRNLDFRYVFMVNMNEDIFPGPQRQGSFMPYRIRKAFDLPTFEVQDSIYAYLFYRLLQNAEQVRFYYNMYADFGLSGEPSRFIRQIALESSQEVIWKKLSNTIELREIQPISVEKTDDILNKLQYYTASGRSRLSASALNTYFECRLRFYFKYVLGLFAKDELTDQLDARRFGNVLHRALELLYQDVVKDRPDRSVQPNDFFTLKSGVNGAIDKAFRQEFGMKDKARYEMKGRNVVMSEVMQKFVNRVLEMDEQYAPFEVVSLEKEDNYERVVQIQPDARPFDVKLGADIDRVDRKNGTVRVIDYKSGRDDKEIGTVEKLFRREKEKANDKGRNKAGFQTFFYAWLYNHKYGDQDAVVPGLINMQELFQPDFDEHLLMDGAPVTDVRPSLPLFEEHLQKLLEEIYGRSQPFDQTNDEQKCRFCDFKGICGR